MAVAVSQVLTDNRKLGDLLRAFFDNAHNFTGGTIKNAVAETVTPTDPLGQPVKQAAGQWQFVAAADIANATGVLVHQRDLPELAQNDITAEKILILVRGPAVIHEDGLPTHDVYGDAIVAADFKARLLALGISCIEGPEKTSTQTT